MVYTKWFDILISQNMSSCADKSGKFVPMRLLVLITKAPQKEKQDIPL